MSIHLPLIQLIFVKQTTGFCRILIQLKENAFGAVLIPQADVSLKSTYLELPMEKLMTAPNKAFALANMTIN